MCNGSISSRCSLRCFEQTWMNIQPPKAYINNLFVKLFVSDSSWLNRITFKYDIASIKHAMFEGGREVNNRLISLLLTSASSHRCKAIWGVLYQSRHQGQGQIITSHTVTVSVGCNYLSLSLIPASSKTPLNDNECVEASGAASECCDSSQWRIMRNKGPTGQSMVRHKVQSNHHAVYPVKYAQCFWDSLYDTVRPAKEKWRYSDTSSLIGWAHCILFCCVYVRRSL